MGNIISFINYKGGVGKTTITANISAELAYRGFKVLLLDLDPQTNLTLSFISPQDWAQLNYEEKTIKHWYDAYLDDNKEVSLRNLIITPNRVNNSISTGKLDLISSHLELINLDLELATMYGGNSDRTIRSKFLNLFSRLKKGLDEIKSEYDIILIDCPPNFNIVTQNAIIASDNYIIPTKADFLSTLGIDQLMRHINSLKEKYNTYVNEIGNANWELVNPSLIGVIFTMIKIYNQNPISAQQSYISQVQRLGYPIFSNFMRNNDTLYASAPEFGVPVSIDGNIKTSYTPMQRELENITSELLTRLNY